MLLQHKTSAKYWQQQHAGGVNNSIVLSGLTREGIHRRISSHQSLKEPRLTHSLRCSPCHYCLGYYSSSICYRIRFTHALTHTHQRLRVSHHVCPTQGERMSFLHYVYETSDITIYLSKKIISRHAIKTCLEGKRKPRARHGSNEHNCNFFFFPPFKESAFAARTVGSVAALLQRLLLKYSREKAP